MNSLPLAPQRFVFFLLASLSLALGSGCGGSGAGSADPVRQVTFSGSSHLKDGTPVNQVAQYRAVIGGTGLFQPGKNGCARTDPHMQAIYSQALPPAGPGQYAWKFDLAQARSLVDPGCSIASVPAAQLDSVRLDVTLPADSVTCAAYCREPDAAASEACASDCRSGSRILLSSKTLTRAELARLVSSDASASLRVNQDLVFTSLGPALSSGAGPDLVVDGAAAQATAHVTEEEFSPTDCAVVENCLGGTGKRKLLRFDGDIVNLGTSPLVLGSPENNPQFEYSACHNHYHLRNMMLYELLTPAGAAVAVGAADVVGRKQGFCMMDTYPANGDASGAVYDCDNQGISPGWADSYSGELDCQWVDVTGVPAGSYVLRITVNPDGIFAESDTTNNSAEVSVVIP